MNETMRSLGAHRSAIRELFEYANTLRATEGEHAVFDFSIGNPSVPPPPMVKDVLVQLCTESDPIKLHGYTSAPGDAQVRKKIATFIRQTYHTSAQADLIYMTSGAAAALAICMRALLCPGDEVCVLTPCFPEYRVFIENAGSLVSEVACPAPDFQPDIKALEQAIGAKCRAVLINSPNNPTGAVYPEKVLRDLAEVLRRKEIAYGHPIYLIADEPYRELVYGGVTVPYPPNFYDNTLVCYSFSKSLSLPGERIGYISVHPGCRDAERVFEAIAGAGRSLGYVCAPALFQFLAARCLGQVSDLATYQKNRDLLCGALREAGFEAAPPDGAFYLFVRAPGGNAHAFLQEAKKYGILFVPSDSFGCPGYVRIAYCVKTEMIERSLCGFRQLAKSYKLCK